LLQDLDKRGLRWRLALFFLALALPSAALIVHAHRQLKWEVFHDYRARAEDLATRIDDRLAALIREEEGRSYADYRFLVVAGDPAASFLQRSPLASYPLSATLPGLIGHFQVDASGAFSTPLLPEPGSDPQRYGLSRSELDARRQLAARLQEILARNRLVAGTRGRTAPQLLEQKAPHGEPRLPPRSAEVESQAAPPSPAAEAGFQALDQRGQTTAGALGSVEDLQLSQRQRTAPGDPPPVPATRAGESEAEQRSARRERGALPDEPLSAAAAAAVDGLRAEQAPQVRIFESEIDPFRFSLLESGHFVLYRTVWRDGDRYVQGVLLEQQPFLRGAVELAVGSRGFSAGLDLLVAFQGEVLTALGAQAGKVTKVAEVTGTLLHQARLAAPLSGMELIFSLRDLPPMPGAWLVSGLSVVLAAVLLGGCYLWYRLGARQIDLARQQQDFVSAVSHELKTPLTSIRMYGEMLREGWVAEDRKLAYYQYIHDESERLSRLINNVLQLARMTRRELRLELRPLTVAELMDGIRSKVASAVERGGFALELRCEGLVGTASVRVDADAFAQILINLVDNAVKFAAESERKVIVLGCRSGAGSDVVFYVRDYGPGVPRAEVKAIFRLFYRAGGELGRETSGTGIGLALVRQLVVAMGGRVEVASRNPGAEFRVRFPAIG
jgi:signal transduction histidine kinase